MQGFSVEEITHLPGISGRADVTDVITDMCLSYLDQRDSERPFCLLCHHKAPHRPWYSDEKHAGMIVWDINIGEKVTSQKRSKLL